jgi:hypothetical protein
VAPGWPSPRDFGADARDRVGIRLFLCRSDDLELAILLHRSYRVLNRDYAMFDFRGVALSEASLKPVGTCVYAV